MDGQLVKHRSQIVKDGSYVAASNFSGFKNVEYGTERRPSFNPVVRVTHDKGIGHVTQVATVCRRLSLSNDNGTDSFSDFHSSDSRRHLTRDENRTKNRPRMITADGEEVKFISKSKKKNEKKEKKAKPNALTSRDYKSHNSFANSVQPSKRNRESSSAGSSHKDKQQTFHSSRSATEDEVQEVDDIEDGQEETEETDTEKVSRERDDSDSKQEGYNYMEKLDDGVSQNDTAN